MKCNPESSIRIFENFVEKEDLKILDNLCRNAKENDNKWWAEKCPSPEYVEHASGAYKELCKEYEYSLENLHPLVIKYIKKLEALASYELGRKLVPIFYFNRHETLEGGWCPGHTDSEGMGKGGIDYVVDYSPNHCYEPSLIDISANIYINDDYEGGELCFPEYDIQIKHTPGQLVWFPGGHEFIHSVNHITKGTRWNLITHLTRPKLIVMHSMVHNLYNVLTPEQKLLFPNSWDDGIWHPGSGGADNNVDGRYGDGYGG